MSGVVPLPKVRGRLTPNAPLAPLVWFKSGGNAEWLFEPADAEDLEQFLGELEPHIPVMALGLGSNLIVRDGGVPGVVVRLGKAFAKIEQMDETTIRCGGGASGILVSSTARDLEKEIVEKRFREDLFYRLNVVPVAVPSLAERRDDIRHARAKK